MYTEWPWVGQSWAQILLGARDFSQWVPGFFDGGKAVGA